MGQPTALLRDRSMRQLTLDDIDTGESLHNSTEICGAETASGGVCQHNTSDDGDPNRCWVDSHNESDVPAEQQPGAKGKVGTHKDDVLEAARMGMSLKGMAEYADIDEATLYRWQWRSPEFGWELRLARPESCRRRGYRQYSPGRSGETVPCEQCGVGDHKSPAQLERNDHHFCSPDCHKQWMSENIVGEAHPDYEGGRRTFRTGPNWRNQREEAIQRDDDQCVACGMSRAAHKQEYGYDIHVHHIEARRNFDDLEKANELSNLVTLCHSCHGTYEGSMLRPAVGE